MMTVQQLALTINKGLYATFGGKPHGSYQIPYSLILKALGLPRMHDDIKRDLEDACMMEDAILHDCGDYFIVCCLSKTDKWRQMPRNLFNDLHNTDMVYASSDSHEQ